MLFQALLDRWASLRADKSHTSEGCPLAAHEYPHHFGRVGAEGEPRAGPQDLLVFPQPPLSSLREIRPSPMNFIMLYINDSCCNVDLLIFNTGFLSVCWVLTRAEDCLSHSAESRMHSPLWRL